MRKLERVVDRRQSPFLKRRPRSAPPRTRIKQLRRRSTTPPPEKITTKAFPPDRPYACLYETFGKAYIHEYKLKLHLRREHPKYMADANAENATHNADHELDEASYQDNYSRKHVNGKSQKQSRQKLNLKTSPTKSAKRKGDSSPTPVTLNVVKKPWPVKEEIYEEEDREETEEDQENVEGWRYAENNEDDDEETEYED